MKFLNNYKKYNRIIYNHNPNNIGLVNEIKKEELNEN